ncbi:MAG: hypothetical protein N3I35_18295 [Clostridia bacterium]|nr:hypothetical protein [Clostridia bacterium]
METIQISNLKNKILNLDTENRIFIDISEVECNAILLLNQQIVSCEILFKSFINTTIEAYTHFSLQKFIDTYTELRLQRDNSVNAAVLGRVGTEVFNIIMSQDYGFVINSELRKIIVFKKQNQNCKTLQNP